MTQRQPSAIQPSNPLWFKDAVIYELHVRSFADSNGDGIGDFPGLITKLDYLRDLGVSALWLLPFYPSPLRDDGYDIADYNRVNPIYGTLDDFRRFLDAAHQRGLRVITELVINHTSSEHPWFQRARRAKPGSPERDFYVWSDDPTRYRETRIIFQDFETSNWTWDSMAGAYYWHRFYHHQPDLNFDNPAVKEAVFAAMDFWMAMGVDGMRLDAVPYLFEREGTNCENLPETHDFLRELRTYIDSRYEDRMLLAEANQWPEDAAAYFGGGDECHMNFHFPLMPRLFMALHQERSYPILDILEQTPEIPETCQWAIFLRNHDELTLEMVTDQDRDYMWRVYAEDPQARINVGIRRRLAPLLRQRRKMELLNALLMSMPGTPVLYYGDEIGMGDNFYLGDRNGVRTPMQWSGDRNAGFSRANPQKLFLPVIIDPEYHYEAINVEAQQHNPQSLLWWTKRLIALRNKHKVFGRGSVEFLRPDNPKVLAFVRSLGDEHVLVVANLSRFSQPVHIDLSEWAGVVPTEMFGRVEFPIIGTDPYLLTLGPHNFVWMRLKEPVEGDGLATLTAPQPWHQMLAPRSSGPLEEALVRYLPRARWFRGKDDVVRGTRITDVLPVGDAHLLTIAVDFRERGTETYMLPIACADGALAEDIENAHPNSVIARLRGDDDPILYDASIQESFGAALFELIRSSDSLRGRTGTLTGHTSAQMESIVGDAEADDLRPVMLGAEQSNTSIAMGDRAVLKLLRVVETGMNSDLELSRFLTEHDFKNTPALGGWLEYRTGDVAATVGLVHRYTNNQGDAWQLTLESIRRSFEWAMSNTSMLDQVEPPNVFVLGLGQQTRSEATDEFLAGYLPLARQLAERTADMHLALASESEARDFRSEEFSTLHQRSLYQAARTELGRACEQLARATRGLPDSLQAAAKRIVASRGAIDERLRHILDHRLDTVRVRVHGDYHLGQVLYTGNDFVIIDFEGEPARSIEDRRSKRSPLRDVAGMLRSFHYAAWTACATTGRADDVEALGPWARAWQHWISATFVDSYLERAQGARFLPAQSGDLAILLDFYLIEKCVYELSYELSSRPKWVGIPIRGLIDLLDTDPTM